ncbi:MAG TPA: VCBS repeat-containing protein [Puia sp.]|nr:VCBS repeat-containing protein [Puia sp.]
MRIFLLPSLLISILFFSCKPAAHNAGGQPIADSAIRSGKALAEVYCQSCHQLPDPALLDKTTWEHGVLPAMGPRLGIFKFGLTHYPSSIRDTAIGPGFYPSRPVLADWQWEDIMDYYSGLAPDSMPPQPEHRAIDTTLSLFEPVMPQGTGHAPVTCYVGVDTAGGRRQIVAGNLFPPQLVCYDAALHLTDSARTKGGIVDMHVSGDSGIACNIGNINPNNGRSGSAGRFWYDKNKKLVVDTASFLNDLARPVEVLGADLNGDSRTDYLVCEFGNLKGALSWMEAMPGGGYVRHILRAQPGAIKAYIQDADHDGRPDIWVLFAQGDEGIFLYLNKGGGRFEEQRLLRFPPVYGSVYFELADMNKDGHPDIVYTSGDNADYSLVFKPYHGVYIFLNDGQNHFRQAYFYPVNGCYKAMARDFDGDGDPDLAVISAFADFKRHPEEGFVYLENEGGLDFRPFSLPAAKAGRWLTMDVGDVDGDGRPDIVLGNLSIGPALSRGTVDWKKGPAVLLLRNKGKRGR